MEMAGSAAGAELRNEPDGRGLETVHQRVIPFREHFNEAIT